MLQTKVEELFSSLGGIFAASVMNSKGEKLVSINETEIFPLASAAKLAISAAVVDKIKSGQMKWDMLMRSEPLLDPKENSDELFPHLQKQSSLQLSDVVEVMIACHDHCCANAIAERFGGWEDLSNDIVRLYGTIHVNKDPRNLEINTASAGDMQTLLFDIYSGYRSEFYVWKPIVSGMVRQTDKDPNDVPLHHHPNMTGGLPTCYMYVGMIGELGTDDILIYTIAGKNLPDRRGNSQSDEAAGTFMRLLYENRYTK